MKILYIGAINPPGGASTTKMRMEELERLGHEVASVDIEKYSRWGGRFPGGLVRRLKWGPPLSRLAEDIHRTAVGFQPEVAWVDKGIWVSAATLRDIKERHRSFLVHYTPDPAIVFHQSRHFLASIPVYDLLVTTKAYELDLYRRHGARNLLHQFSSFDARVHRPRVPTPEEKRLYESDIVFVGTYTPGRERYLRPLARLGVNLAIWGGNWRERCRDKELRPYVRGGALSADDYVLALCSTRLALGLLSPLVPDLSTTRSLEIPACGAFLLAERTDEHLALFEEGKEAEFFASEEELIHKVGYYLEHDAERRRVAEAGRQRCLSSGHSTEDRVREIIDRIHQLIAGTG